MSLCEDIEKISASLVRSPWMTNLTAALEPKPLSR